MPSNEIPRQPRRRRAAGCRLPPLPCDHRAPSGHDGQEPVTAKALDTWRKTRNHIRAAGYEPILPGIIRELIDEVPPGEDAT